MLKPFQDYQFKDQRVLVRVDFNVPLDENFEITDTTRIDESLPTLRKIIQDGGIPVIMSHLGRPKSGYEEKYSLKHVFDYLSSSLGSPGIFATDCVDEKAHLAVKECPPNGFVLLENLRFHSEEEKGDLGFAAALAELGDFYVNDAFGTAHRAHASTTIVARFFPKRCAFGFLIEKELEALEKVLFRPQRPFYAVIGGAKVSDKMGVLEKLLETADGILVGGAMAFTFLGAQGARVGHSLCEPDKYSVCLELIQKAKNLGKKLLFPLDVRIAQEIKDAAPVKTCLSNEIPEGWKGLDIGPETVELFIRELKNARTILWNGPMGVFEVPAFRFGTEEVAKGIAMASRFGAFSVVGGGDSVAAVHLLGLKNQVSYVCTGGGAMLEFVEGKVLPGIAAIREYA